VIARHHPSRFAKLKIRQSTISTVGQPELPLAVDDEMDERLDAIEQAVARARRLMGYSESRFRRGDSIRLRLPAQRDRDLRAPIPMAAGYDGKERSRGRPEVPGAKLIPGGIRKLLQCFVLGLILTAPFEAKMPFI